MRSLLVILCVLAVVLEVSARKNANGRGRKCGLKRCRAGQRCTENSDGEKICKCRPYCPQKKYNVCGSDGRTYYNKCELHRLACVEKRKLKIAHNGHCRNNDVLPDENESKSTNQKAPLVCYQIQRDELRQLLVDWVKRRSLKDGKDYQEVVTDIFEECDQDRSGVLDADELLRCTERAGLNVKDTSAHILRGLCVDALISIASRGLCVDALISIASRDKNWVLQELELQHLLAPNFEAPVKECQLEDKKYQDGWKTVVDCNVCVCACGDWVCTGVPCKDVKNPGIPGPVTKGSLPSMGQRETFLNGFKAADEVNIPALIDEVANKKRSQDIASQLDELNSKH